MKIFKIRLSTIHYASGVLDKSVYDKYIKCLDDYYISIGDIKNCDDFSYHIWCDYLNLRDNSILRIFSGGMMDVSDYPEVVSMIRDIKIKNILENG
jgi:hypothetical protein